MGVEPVLGLEHTGGEALGRVAVEHRHGGLGDDRSVIHVGAHARAPCSR